MTTDTGACHISSRGDPVVALHCSGADGGEWRNLAATLGTEFHVIAPSLIGCGDRGSWNGRHSFSLMDEANAIIELVDGLDEKVHLIGHSYGGGVAMKVAVNRPERIASLALYEPSAFHILRRVGPTATPELAEIERLAAAIGKGLVTGAYQEAAATFVDYWNGRGAWASLRPGVRNSLLSWLPKAPLDFQALLEDSTPLSKLADIKCPVLLLRGDLAPGPSRRIVNELARLLPSTSIEVVLNAGHMGPLTHASAVSALIAAHLRIATRDHVANVQPEDMAA